jgi:D-alanyl-D-alanine carboxypeptidase
MPQKDNDLQLEEFRYDAKLFKQAYRAGLKAKKLEKESRRNKRLKVLFATITVILVFILTSFVLRSSFFKQDNYIKAFGNLEQLSIVNTEFESAPFSKNDFDLSKVGCKAALYANLDNGEIYYSKNIDEKRYIASLTKLMTALIALKEYDLNEEVEVKKDWYQEEFVGWSIELDKGDKISVENLLKAMLISSYNDASYILAEHAEGGLDSYVEKMNQFSSVLGLENTEFNNPSGLDDNGGNFSSVRDLYKLATIVVKNETLMSILNQGYADLKWDIGEERIFTTNVLLGQNGVVGGKTGYTEDAGECYLAITADNDVIIILGSEDRFDDAEKLLEI